MPSNITTLGQYLAYVFSDSYSPSHPPPRFRSNNHPVDGTSRATEYYLDRKSLKAASQEIRVIPVCPQTEKCLETVTIFRTNRLKDRIVA